MDSMILVEFISIADGMSFTHTVLKNVGVTLAKQEVICPGKYVVLLKGHAQAVKTVEAYALPYQSIIAKTVLLKLHGAVMTSINRKIEFSKGNNYAVVETKKYIHSLEAADIVAKNTNVFLEKVVDRLGLVGKGVLIISGTSADLRLADKLIRQKIGSDEILSTAILDAVKEDIFNI